MVEDVHLELDASVEVNIALPAVTSLVAVRESRVKLDLLKMAAAAMRSSVRRAAVKAPASKCLKSTRKMIEMLRNYSQHFEHAHTENLKIAAPNVSITP